MRSVNEVRAHLPSGIKREANAESSSGKRPQITRKQVGELNIFRERFAEQRALGGAKK
ncbi:hypothetical protein [Thermococcus gorgonarius]|uniref:hypothetical protein n=1 Tax=Thermococcus gorgonarius TaxID=71997 RepID=UPI0012FD621B|nr:hypothetical protein [Thermococcus gorgonarius]